MAKKTYKEETAQSIQDVLDLLAEWKPVIALKPLSAKKKAKLKNSPGYHPKAKV